MIDRRSVMRGSGAAAAALGHRAIAIADRNSLAGIARAHQACKALALKLVVACRLEFRDGCEVLVYPLEVELCLAEHPEVRECAVFAAELPDRRMTLKAVVVMNSAAFDATEATKRLQDFVKAKLLPYKYPREVKFIDELPKTGTGKIDRQAVMRI